MERTIVLKNISLTSLIFGLFVLITTLAYAASTSTPVGPDSLNVSSSGRRTGSEAGFPLSAEAGNVTALEIQDTRITEAWQGYYGNITGVITLDDASNNTLYDWALPNPTGEVYASNGSSVTWASVYCINFTINENASQGGQYPFNLTVLENKYDINSTDVDGFDETFNSTYVNATGFEIGTVTIDTTDSCRMVTTYVNDVYQANQFKEVLVTDNVSIIFVALLENSVDGFKANSDPHDFQMLVAENGHGTNATIATTYYFFVELA